MNKCSCRHLQRFTLSNRFYIIIGLGSYDTSSSCGKEPASGRPYKKKGMPQKKKRIPHKHKGIV